MHALRAIRRWMIFMRCWSMPICASPKIAMLTIPGCLLIAADLATASRSSIRRRFLVATNNQSPRKGLNMDKIMNTSPTHPYTWQSMETAPKDGTAILLLIDGKAIQGSYEKPFYRGSDPWPVVSLPTHGCGCCEYDNPLPEGWAPLP